MRFLPVVALLALAWLSPRTHAQLPKTGNLSRSNLVAWCIVPFDSQKRTPAQRAEMLQRLGIQRLAYDWRAEHIPSFDAEVDAMAARGIEMTAWWFPAALNSEAKAILATIERKRIHPQLWVTMGTEPEPNPERLEAMLADAVGTLAPICREAARLGCTVALYNHLGWFGEPVHSTRVVQRLHAAGHRNVGIVYNFHHAHAHIDDFADVLRVLKPHLLALNLNGMVRGGDTTGRKIIPLGTGDEELAMLRVLHASGWSGPVGIIGHTDEDAEAKLRKELAGLERLAPLSLLAAAPRPSGAVAAVVTPAPASAPAGRKPGEPAVSGKAPGVQGERDWVDNRWQQTDLGPAFAATLKMPDGTTVARAMAIRLGTDAAVAYDTATGSWRGAWSGDFIRFDPARFGLIGTPRAGGSAALKLSKEAAWPGANPRLEAIERPDDSRVVLAWNIHGARVLEVASFVEIGGDRGWVRTLEIPAHAEPWTFVPGLVVSGSSATSEATSSDTSSSSPGRKPSQGVREGVRLRGHGMASEGDRATGMAWLASEASGVEVGGLGSTDAVRITLAASTRPMVLAVVSWSGKASDAARFHETAKKLSMPTHPSAVARLERRADKPLKTQGQRGSDADFLAVDTLTMPYENPDNALMFGSGVDVGPDGAVYVCTIHGDVWKVTGVDADLRELTWRRFATGLYQPLGLKVVDGKVHVLGRDRITRLEDRNGDGHADLYATHFDGIATSPGGHDYVAGLELDATGRLYYADPNGVHRVERDGSGATTLATGFRNPNSLGVRGLKGTTPVVTVSPQQGTWTPSSGIWEVREGLYGGYGGPRKTEARPAGYDAPLCWIPHGVDNSSGSQAWIPEGQWGPLGGLPLHLMWGRCGALLLLRDTDASGAGVQGAVVPLPAKFLSGPNRATFNPADGSLLVAGSTGWQTSAVKDGALQRVRFTGKPVNVPVGWRVVPGGMEVRFALPLDPATVADIGSYSVRAWNYRYAEAYGSKDWSLKNPAKEGRDDWTVSGAKVGADGKSVVLAIAEMGPVMQGELKYNVNPAGGGKALRGSLWFTVNRP